MATDRVEQSSTGSGVEQLPQLLDGPTLARLLGTTERHVRRLVAERRIPFVRVGRFIRFEPNAIARWLEDRVISVGDFASSRAGTVNRHLRVSIAPGDPRDRGLRPASHPDVNMEAAP